MEDNVIVQKNSLSALSYQTVRQQISYESLIIHLWCTKSLKTVLEKSRVFACIEDEKISQTEKNGALFRCSHITGKVLVIVAIFESFEVDTVSGRPLLEPGIWSLECDSHRKTSACLHREDRKQ